jgi:hypothetical protein
MKLEQKRRMYEEGSKVKRKRKRQGELPTNDK